jgi:hypothetical protein
MDRHNRKIDIADHPIDRIAPALDDSVLQRPRELREYPVVDVVEAIGAFSQPGLLVTDAKQVDTKILAGHAHTNLVVAPLSREPGLFD